MRFASAAVSKRNTSDQENVMLLGIIGWIVMGLLIGFIAQKFVNLRGDDPKLGIGVATGAAIIMGILYSIISGAGVTAWNPWSLFFAAIGAVGGAVIWHIVRSRSISHAGHTSRRSY
jgi:uncharacterized membrane protein YeaQ/YmgE (transglycosylase-associated protein family)